ncbi:MAG: hypothetical protein E2O96_04945 [Acidobacteria bacterium]|nr:MAG: hypothetical protein E2O96_04945 [Acidobacteriota bacterium]
MGRSAALVGVFALVLFACTSGDVLEDTSTSSTQPAIASALGADSASDGATTDTADPLTTNEPSTTETTGLATTSSTTTTVSTTVTTSPPTPTTTATTTLPPTTTTVPPTTHFVSMGDNFFAPAPVTISVGDTIRWTNGGDDRHTTTSYDGLWDSLNLKTGASYSQTFPVAGTFQYFCTIHGGMQATVIVQG